MKNRLQLRYHIPETLPSRDGAMEYLKESFHNGFKNTADNASLPAEPLVLLYNDTKLDLENGITEAKRRETSNVILAIGRGGDGIEKGNNIDYFVIDFAKHTEDIHNLNEALLSEENRALISEKELSDLIVALQNALSNEEQLRIKSDNDNNEAIKSETLRSTNVEEELRTMILNEISRSESEEENLQEQILSEIENRKESDRQLKQNIDDNHDLLNIEIINRTNSDEALSTKIENLISAEEASRKSSDDLIYAKINSDINEVNSKIESNLEKINENKVVSNNKTIVVTGPFENGTNLDVNVDNETIVFNETGILSIRVNENDKILSTDSNGLLSTLSLKWVKNSSENQKDEIQLIGKNGIIISRVEVADFLKDGMIDDVDLDTSDSLNPLLIFTFNSSEGKKQINLNVKDLVDTYHAGNGLIKNENTFSVLIDKNSEKFLTLNDSGLNLNGIQSAIDNAKNELSEKIDTINGVRSTDGSIKSKIYESALGGRIGKVEEIEKYDNKTNSLLRKFVTDGTPYFYVSNDTVDMRHNEETLNTVINTIIENVTTNVSKYDSLKDEILKNEETTSTAYNTLHKEIIELQNTIKNLRTEIDTLNSELNIIKSNAITEIKGTNNEIQINRDGNSATIGFANDAYFVAGSLD